MTDPDQPEQPAEVSGEPLQEADEPTRNTRPQPTSRFSLPRNKRAWLAITLSLLALAGVSAALIAVATGGGNKTTSASGAPSAATGTATPGSSASRAAVSSSKAGQSHNGVSKSKDNVTSAAKLAESGGALSLPASMKNSVLTWHAGRGGTDLATVSSQVGAVLQSGGIRQYAMMKNACGQLVGGVSAAQAGPPIPVTAMQALYAKALAELAKGAVDCRAAIFTTPDGDETVKTAVNATMLHQSTSELAAGADNIFRATAEIEIASRQHH